MSVEVIDAWIGLSTPFPVLLGVTDALPTPPAGLAVVVGFVPESAGGRRLLGKALLEIEFVMPSPTADPPKSEGNESVIQALMMLLS